MTQKIPFTVKPTKIAFFILFSNQELLTGCHRHRHLRLYPHGRTLRLSVLHDFIGLAELLRQHSAPLVTNGCKHVNRAVVGCHSQ
jgi:hypothetical protein